MKADDKKKLEISLSLKMEDDTIDYSLAVNREKQTYVASYKIAEEGYSLYDGSYTYKNEYTYKGSFIEDGSITTVTIDKIVNKYGRDYEFSDEYDYEYENVIKLDFEIVVDTKDKMPSLKKNYFSISDITEDDIEFWIEKLDSAF